jgi:hypothetical protein
MYLPLVALAALLAAPPQALPGAPRLSVGLSFIEPNGKAWGDRQIDAVLGSETPAEFKDRNRTVHVNTTMRLAAKADCYTAAIVVKDQDIDATGRFSKKEWKTQGEVCNGFYITLGPREETRVRISLQQPK